MTGRVYPIRCLLVSAVGASHRLRNHLWPTSHSGQDDRLVALRDRAVAQCPAPMAGMLTHLLAYDDWKSIPIEKRKIVTTSIPQPPIDPEGYVPGTCNIGPAERQQRRRVGIVGSVTAVVLFAVLFATHASKPWRLLLFLPVAGAASGFLQDRLHFCAGYGLRGVANVLAPVGETEDVTTAGFRKQDQRKAHQIIGFSVAIGAVVTGIAWVM